MSGPRRAFSRRRFGNALCLAALAAACALPAAAAASEPLRIANLRVEGGEASWHATNVFRVDWEQVPGPPAEPAAAIYRVYDSGGALVEGPVRETTKLTAIDTIPVPAAPGAYTLEIWLEDPEGQAGPAAHAQLRFDDAAPLPPAPVAPSPWLAGSAGARLAIGHPPAPLPVSGIRGYAVSLDRGSGAPPCAQPAWCSLAETDLAGGLEDDSFVLGTLPEGTSFARVVAVSGSGVASPVASVALRVDGTAPLISLQGLPSGWINGPVRLTATASDPLSGMAAAGPNGPFTAIAVDGGAPAQAAGDAVSTWVSGDGVHRVAYFARDAAGNLGAGAGSNPATATVAIDQQPPRVRFATAQDPAEPERIEATVADELSGPSAARGAIMLRRAGTDAAYATLPTRATAGRLVAHWDSDAYPPGKYEFLATGYDRAGNAATGSDRIRGARMVLVNPVKSVVSLEAGFGGRRLVYQRCHRVRHRRRCHRRQVTRFDARPSRRVVPFGRGVRFGGRLTGARGVPVGGREVAVTETFSPGAEPPRRTTVVRTAADGTFSLRLAPGPSREVSAAFAGSPTLTRAAAPSVRLDVLAAVRLHASAAAATIGGAPVVFAGRVDPAGVAGPVEGLPVELQFRYPGAGWSEFRTVEADASGRFRYAYRFSDDDSRGVRFQFRAHVKGREGWPYEPAYSRPVAVLGQ